MENTLAGRIRQRLDETSMDMKTASRAAGLGDTFVRDVIARGRSPRSDALVKLAEALGVSPQWLLTGEEDEARKGGYPAPNASPPVPVNFPSGRIAMLGSAIGGADGKFVLNGQKIMDVLCPPQLLGVPDAYGVFVHGVSMEPRYYAGEAVFLNPHLPVRQGDFVVAQIGGEYEGDDVGAYVKRFVSMNSSELVLEQFTPREDAGGTDVERERYLLRFPRNRVIAVHKIIMSGIV